MIVLDSETVDMVDSIGSTLVNEVWEPKGKATEAKREAVEETLHDLNLLMPWTLRPEEPRLEGREEAYASVLSDIAIRVSQELVQARDAGALKGIERTSIDPSIAFDPVGLDLDEDYKAGKRAQELDWAQRALEARGAPPPSLFDRGAIAPETATRLAEIGERLVATSQFRRNSTPETAKAHGEVVRHADRIRRAMRQRDRSSDPERRAAYDLVSADIGIRLAQTISAADERHILKRGALSSEERRLAVDPHGIGSKGLLAQASRLAPGASAGSKGPRAEEPQAPMRAGVER